ncbi:MAG: hypothetical protein C3F13_17805 [Anaerolineales bacterium]|nr:DUF2267 domain-containing protein [Anaerolineae bacterium]PWB49944.1 MAG: hypothetical protein C3F13_17805 [Anaerolineales bacterium]
MDGLIKLVSQKTGLPNDKAKIAVDTVLNFLKQKLPPSMAGQLDAVMVGGGAIPDDLTKSLGGLLGGKK